MAEQLKKLPTVEDSDVAKIGVTHLADRPNQAASYGKGGLSSSQLKAWFDQLANAVRTQANGISAALNGEDALDYIPIGDAIADTQGGERLIVTLGDLVRAVKSGLLADLINVDDAYTGGTGNELSLQQMIYTILGTLSNHYGQIEILKGMEITETKDGNEDPVYYLAFNGGTHGKGITIPLSDIKKLQDRATDIETEIGEVDGRGGTVWNRLIAAEYDIDGLQSAVGTDGASGTIKGRIKAVESGVSSLEKRTATAEADINAVEGRAADLEGRATTAEANIANLTNRLNGLSVLKAVGFSEETDTLTFTFSSGEVVRIGLADFVDSAELKAKLESDIVGEFKEELNAHADALKVPLSALEESASRSAENAQQYASNASYSEANARVYAERAETAKADAETARDNAYSATSSASNLAGMAATSASEAAEYASQARSSASVAIAEASKFAIFDKRLQNLENGISPDPFVTDDTVAYQKTVPASALPFAALERVGGMSVVIDGTLRHAAVTEMESIGTNLWDEVTEIGGITSANGLNQDSQIGVLRSKNYIRISPNNPLFVGIYATGQVFVFFYDSHKIYIGSYGVWLGSGTIQPPENAYYVRFQLNSAYGTTYKNDVILAHSSKAVDYVPFVKNTLPIPEAIQALEGYGFGISTDVHNYIDFENTEYVQMCSERAYQSGDENNPAVVTDGTRTVYALTTPVRTPITFTDNYIRVGGSGTLTFVNEHSMAAPSTVTYLMKEASV